MTHTPLPPLALSVRQPWAWAIIHGGKPVENRDWRKPNPGLAFRGCVAIHASSGMTRDEYADAADFMLHSCGVVAPEPHLLVRGAIIGSVDVVDVTRYAGPCTAEQRASPWFVGPVGLWLAHPAPCEPVPAKGALGFFKWETGGEITPPARWMLPPPAPAEIINPQGDLL